MVRILVPSSGGIIAMELVGTSCCQLGGGLATEVALSHNKTDRWEAHLLILTHTGQLDDYCPRLWKMTTLLTSNQILAPKYQFKCIMVFLWPSFTSSRNKCTPKAKEGQRKTMMHLNWYFGAKIWLLVQSVTTERLKEKNVILSGILIVREKTEPGKVWWWWVVPCALYD